MNGSPSDQELPDGPRRRLQFSMRRLLLLTVAVVVWFGALLVAGMRRRYKEVL